MARIPEAEIEHLKRSVDLVALVCGSGVALKRSGGNWLGLCPYHADGAEPSLSVTPVRGLWHCFGCGCGGSAIDWVMKRDGVGFRRASLHLKGEAPIAAPAHARRRASVPETQADPAADRALLLEVVAHCRRRLTESPAALTYPESRGLVHPELVTRFPLGYAGRLRAADRSRGRVSASSRVSHTRLLRAIPPGSPQPPLDNSPLAAKAVTRPPNGGKSTCNIAAISDALFEDALFGHVPGGFTGAVGKLAGYIEQADRGTLFLDEIGELSPMNQAKLLRALQTRSFRPLGAAADRRSEFRLVTATNQDLDVLVGDGRFRPDLYYRLKCVVLDVPKLRDRAEDVPLLIRHFATLAGVAAEEVDLEGEELLDLFRYEWPGNVRELEHAVRSARLRSATGSIRVADILAALRRSARPVKSDPSAGTERARLVNVLHRFDWNTELTAGHFGVDRATVYRWMRRLDIPRPRASAFSRRLALAAAHDDTLA